MAAVAEDRYSLADAYITDERRLFRVVTPFNDDAPDTALLEDCLTLDLEWYSASELAAMPLRLVTRT